MILASRFLAAAAVLVGAALSSSAQTPAGSAEARATADHGRILLVLPFDNRTGQPNLEWMREAASELITARLAAAGFAPTTRAQRTYALDHLGLPQNFQPSRASAIRLARMLDADAVVVGSYSIVGGNLQAEAEVIDVPHLHMSDPVAEGGAMAEMIAVFDNLAWQLTGQLRPGYAGSNQSFIEADKSLRLDAFEQYIRGIMEPDQAEKLKHLEQAVKLSPTMSQAWMALGREQYQGQKYEEAAQALARVDRSGPDGGEAGFFRGLSLLSTGSYAEAEKAFADVARILPLAEVVNNQAVAMSRQGHDGTSLFVQAAADDPGNADYHFNLAVSLRRRGNTAAAQTELAQCLKLRPADSEALGLQEAWKKPASAQPPAGGALAVTDSVERIARTLDETAFRQATQMLDQMNEAVMTGLGPQQRAEKLQAEADGYLGRGMYVEAERLYRLAASANPLATDALVGVARSLEREGNADGARAEAQAALASAPSAAAWVVMAEIDLAAGRTNEARQEAGNALRIDPVNAAAQALLKQIPNPPQPQNRSVRP